MNDINIFDDDDDVLRVQQKFDTEEDDGEVQDTEVTVYLKKDQVCMPVSVTANPPLFFFQRGEKRRYLNPVAATLSIDEGDLEVNVRI